MRGYCLQEISKETFLKIESNSRNSVYEIRNIDSFRIYQKHSNMKINLPRNIIKL